MVVTVYQGERGRFSFTSTDGATAIPIDVPDGSELQPIPGLGLHLLVPEGPRVRFAWAADQVWDAAVERRPGFRLLRVVQV